MSLLLQVLLLFTLCLCLTANFLPDVKDYNAYGVKMAANNLIIVQADNELGEFLIQFAPFTDDIDDNYARGCLLEYDDVSHYIYTVALGKNQSTYNFFFVGEVMDLDEYSRIANRTFVGMISYNGPLDTIDCSDFSDGDVQYVPYAYPHQEHLVMVTDPPGSVAYVFSNLFTFSYTANTKRLVVNRTNSLSPTSEFLPFAVDYDGTRGIIAGFLRNNRNERVQYSPTVILFGINALTTIPIAISKWSYPINGSTWQAGLTNQGVDQYVAKFDMSVSINPTATQVLVGIQWMNMVLLFNYTTTSLTLITLKDNGKNNVGFGKSVGWFNDGVDRFAILENVYSRSYVWSSSQINIYNSPLINISKPFSVFPNVQQPLYSFMSRVFLNIITTPTYLILLDTQGYLFVILSAPIGYYSSTIGPSSEIIPAISSYMPCMPGTYKNTTGIFPCSLCPPETKSDGTNATLTACVSCAMNAFCPLGSITDSISNDQLGDVIQVGAYPKSPDISGLDDILFFTLFSIGSSPRCVALSPIFWTLVSAAIVILLTTVLWLIEHCAPNPKAVNIAKRIIRFFKRADLIREGDMWVGGLTTFCVLVLCISCCVFSAKYYTSYPIETAEPSTYTCDTTLRNAQFSSSLQSSSIPVSTDMQEMIDLLNDQTVNLTVAFINTVYNCTSDEATLTFFSGTKLLPISLDFSCSSSNYIVSYSALLPFRSTTVQFTLPNTRIIGGIRIGLSAPGNSQSSTTTLQDLAFSYAFNQTGRIFGQDAYVGLQLTKVINSTNPLVSGGDEILSGIWTGSSTINYNESFVTDTDYLTLSVNEVETHLTIEISETSYYILNEQSPIARLPEIIYHDFLFITMIIGTFVLIFIIVEITILPCVTRVLNKDKEKSNEKNVSDNRRPSSSSQARSPSNKQDSTSPEHINLNFIPEAIFTANQHNNHDQNDGQYLSSAYYRKTYF